MRRDHHVRSKQFNTSEESLNRVFCEPSGNTRLNNAPAPVPYINERDTTAAPPRAKHGSNYQPNGGFKET